MSRERRARICCLDLDTFFVSVERLLEPSLEGRPVIVGGPRGARGVVTACSYEVRAFGVRSGMPLRDASRLAPRDTVFLPPRHDTYGEHAARVRAIAARFSPEIQVASIDEMYMSFAGCERLYYQPGDANEDATIERAVRELTATLRRELGLPSSAGVASSRSMAKVACGLAKPAGVRLVRVGEEAAVLAPLPVRKLPGIGPVAEEKLARLGITTLGELAEAPVARLRGVLGAWAESTKLRARGEGADDLGEERPAFREHDVEGGVEGSISNEQTFSEDVMDPAQIEARLCALAERVAWRARRRGARARTVTLKLRYADFQTLTRSRALAPTNADREVLAAVQGLYAEARTRATPVRLLGVALSKLELDRQLPLLGGDERLSGAVDGIRARFGYDAVRLARGATQKGRG